MLRAGPTPVRGRDPGAGAGAALSRHAFRRASPTTRGYRLSLMWVSAPRSLFAVGIAALAAACSGEPDGSGSVKDLDATAGATGGGHASGTDDASPPGSSGASGGTRSMDASLGASQDSSTSADAGTPDPDGSPVMPPPNPCAPVTFPSGIAIATFRDAAMSAVYDDISARTATRGPSAGSTSIGWKIRARA